MGFESTFRLEQVKDPNNSRRSSAAKADYQW